MFPWEKKTQTNFYPRNDNRYPSVERKHNISVAADTRDYHNHFLPPIHNPNNISQYEDLSYHTPNMRESQNYQYQEENSIFRKSKYYPRSQSFSPFQERTGKRRSIIEQQKNYAKFLEAQIRDKKSGKTQSKLKAIELEKKLLEKSEFYEGFGTDNPAEKYRKKMFSKGLENTPEKSIRYSVGREDTLENNKSILEKQTTFDSYEEDKASPLKIEKTEPNETLLDISRPVHTNTSNNGDDYLIKEKTKEYIKKLEYKMALEQQIAEQRLKKQHQDELIAMEERLEGLKISYNRLKTKPAQESPFKGDKQGQIPIIIHGPDGTASEVYKADKSRVVIRRPSASRKLVPPQNIPNSDSSTSSRLSARNKIQGVKATLTVPELNLENELNESRHSHNNETTNTTYQTIQDELFHIKHEMKGHMNKMDYKINELRNGELLQNRSLLHRQLIEENPRLVATPFTVSEPSYLQPSQNQASSSINKLNTIGSKNSLLNDTQFVPVADVSGLKGRSQYHNNIYYPSHHGLSNKLNVLHSAEKAVSNEFDPFMTNIVSYTKKLENSIYQQRQKISKDLGNVQRELRSLKKGESYSEKSRLNTEGTEYETSPIKRPPLETSLRTINLRESGNGLENTTKMTRLKKRRYSRNLQYSQRGTKRKRSDIEGENNEEEMHQAPQNETIAQNLS